MNHLTRAWFGRNWGALALEGLKQIPRPVGFPCLFCTEPIGPDDDGFVTPVLRPRLSYEPIHRECDLRAIVGAVGHLIGRCSCHGGTMGDPPYLTRRQAARAATILFEEHRGYEIGLVAPDSITCFTCGRTSYSPEDIRLRYCGECHVFHLFRDGARAVGFPDHLSQGEN